MEEFKFKVPPDSKLRIDKFLSEEFAKIKPEITRSKTQKLILQGQIQDENGQKITDISKKIQNLQELSVIIPQTKPLDLEAKDIDFEIIFEDDDLIIINKPTNLTVHPGAGTKGQTLVNGLLFSHGKQSLSNINGAFRPGIIHRLDKNTSGLMIVAKNDLSHQILSQDLQERKINRYYLAYIYGVIEPKSGKIEKNISRDRNNRLKMTTKSNQKSKSRNAITNYKTYEIFKNNIASLVKCKLETGRTHQIRVHFESQKHSIIGDNIYNSCKKSFPENFDQASKEFIQNFDRQALHAYKISFNHPKTKEKLEFEAKMPQDMQNLHRALLEEYFIEI